MKNAMFGLSVKFCKKSQNFSLSKAVHTNIRVGPGMFCNGEQTQQTSEFLVINKDNLFSTRRADVKPCDINSITVTGKRL